MRTDRRGDGVFGPPLNEGVRDGSSGTLEIGNVDRGQTPQAGRSRPARGRNPPTRNLGPALTDRSGLRGPETTTRIVGLHRRFVGESPASPSSLEAPFEPLGSTPIRQTGPRRSGLQPTHALRTTPPPRMNGSGGSRGGESNRTDAVDADRIGCRSAPLRAVDHACVVEVACPLNDSCADLAGPPRRSPGRTARRRRGPPCP